MDHKEIDDWFYQNFGHLTPGTPDYVHAQRAAEDLKKRLNRTLIKAQLNSEGD